MWAKTVTAETLRKHLLFLCFDQFIVGSGFFVLFCFAFFFSLLLWLLCLLLFLFRLWGFQIIFLISFMYCFFYFGFLLFCVFFYLFFGVLFHFIVYMKLQYFGHLMWSIRKRPGKKNSLEKTLILGKIEGKRRGGWHRMRWLESNIEHWMDRYWFRLS